MIVAGLSRLIDIRRHCFVLVIAGALALAGPGSATAAKRHHQGHRVGGVVHNAWPRTGKAPRTRQARWLARQVGAVRPRRRHRTATASMSVVAGDPGSPAGPRARIAASSTTRTLRLVRSYEIPTDDPSYERLANWSWIYDSAVGAAAFAATGDKANAAQLIDQLGALQYKDGSLEIAFNTVTGEGAQVFRSGTVAWVGLAAATYDQAFGTTRYLDNEERAADYLLSLQTASGLIKGGPDVSWVSTQHNQIAYVFLSRLASELRAAGATDAAATYQKSASAIAAAINKNLLVDDKSGARFRQGLDDDTEAVDVQALGAMYLQGTGQPDLAAKVLAYAQKRFALDNRSIELSKDKDTFNMTYEAKGPLAGYAPYAGDGTPDVLWAEASGEMRLAQAALGQDTKAVDESIADWAAVTKDSGPLQSDRTITGGPLASSYHVWPASTAAAWTMLAQSPSRFLAAPLPAEPITNWAKIRGGNLITTYPDGSVDMTGAGERRVLSPGTASDYTATSKVTLLSGAGYGIYVRGTTDATGKLTAYCVQLDHAYGTGQIVVREILNDVELSVPIVHVGVPTGFAWYGVAHAVGVTVQGNTMKVGLDGSQLISVPDLAAASRFAVTYAYGAASTLTPPTAGGYGLRSWGDGVVKLQQMTVSATG